MRPFIALILVMSLAFQAVLAGPRDIMGVEEVRVETPVGTLPRLPYRLRVTYSDGSSELRQVRWADEDPAREAGSEYRVNGYLSGDNSSPEGYPVSAFVRVVSNEWAVPSFKPVAEPIPLKDVSLVGDNLLTSHRDLDVREMLSWDVKRFLYNYRDTYGLSTEGYPEPEGWDSPDTKLKGHGSGHYMSALAFAYAGCQDEGTRKELLIRIKTMVDGLRECQERTFVWSEELGRYREARDYAPEEQLKEMKGTWEDFDRYKKDFSEYGYGYLNAIPAAHCALVEMYRPYNNSSWVWAPYYTVHKQLAGLIDIATCVEDKDISSKALLIAKDMGLWVWNRLHYRTFVKEDGTSEERRSRPGNRYEMWNMYIAGEVGGMAESLSRLSEMVRDREEKARLLEAAGYFDSPAFFDPLSRNIDSIRGRHANQHIPMVTGALRSYRSNHDPYYYNLALNFWTMIQGRYRYATGGVGIGEMFKEPYSQMTTMVASPHPEMNETCCAYNMAKLSKDLNCFDPDDSRYMDYYERVMYNQIAGSLHPQEYKTTYQYAVGLNASKPWGNRTPQESCCGGTGSENHVKYQEAAYFVSKDAVWIALYLPTEAYWGRKRITLSQDCSWPAERSVIRIKKGRGRFAMKLRIPYWATEGFGISLNGKLLADEFVPGSYFTIPKRRWTRKDVVEVTMPFVRHMDYGPDKVTFAEEEWLGAVMEGPLVMAATGIDSWDDAVLHIGEDGLPQDDIKFIPDYQVDTSATHYFRLHP